MAQPAARHGRPVTCTQQEWPEGCFIVLTGQLIRAHRFCDDRKRWRDEPHQPNADAAGATEPATSFFLCSRPPATAGSGANRLRSSVDVSKALLEYEVRGISEVNHIDAA